MNSVVQNLLHCFVDQQADQSACKFVAGLICNGNFEQIIQIPDDDYIWVVRHIAVLTSSVQEEVMI